MAILIIFTILIGVLIWALTYTFFFTIFLADEAKFGEEDWRMAVKTARAKALRNATSALIGYVVTISIMRLL